jgi:primosomal protein N' (replication factor Y)
LTGAPAARPLLVALDLPLRAGDAAFTFGAATPDVRRGSAVVVPFGRRLMPGIVLGEDAPRPALRPVLAASPEPLVPAAVVDLAEWLATEYLSSVGEALAAVLPWDALWSGLRLRVDGAVPTGLRPEAAAVLESIHRRPVTLAGAWRLLERSGTADALAASGMLKVSVGSGTAPGGTPPDLSGRTDSSDRIAQASRHGASAASRVDAAIAEALGGGPRGLVVAGWRRAPAYVAAIARVLAQDWSAVAAFATVEAAAAFAQAAEAAGLTPVLLHGEQKPAQRLAAWRAVADRARVLVVGTRASIFAPVRDPVLAIVDDEDHSGHKEERAPRYVTAVVAAERTRPRGILVLGATTPTVATYAGAAGGRLRLVALPSPRPRIGVVDLRRRADPHAPLSRPVVEAVRQIVRRGGRVVVLRDRKGYASGLHCLECGAVERCPRCAVAMAYDRAGRVLRCAICGATRPAPAVCFACGAPRLVSVGGGTARVAAYVRHLSRWVARFDSDVASAQTAEGILASFRERGGVLVATQAVIPYLEALHPDLVVVAHADQMLHRPEYRAAERALAFLRSIAIATRAQVLVETADPAHPAIRAALAPSLRPFYEGELEQRRVLGYPPYRSLLRVALAARQPAALESITTRLAADASPVLDVLGPTPRPRGRPGGAAQVEVVIKAADRGAARSLLRPYLLRPGRGVEIAVDVDPHEL